jgi:hypothetical protein
VNKHYLLENVGYSLPCLCGNINYRRICHI